MREAVHAYSVQLQTELAHAPPEVGLSSNPYDYVPYCPTLRRVVALGPLAPPAIAEEIETARTDGLAAYLLAIAGAEIQAKGGQSMGPKTWESANGWAQQYREWARQHPPDS